MAASATVPITRISRIKQHRIFRDFTWPSSLNDFGRYNIVYGWNGSGKSTLANIFDHIARRANVEEGTVELVINGNSVLSSSLDSGAALPQVRVFNRERVVQTISEAESPLGPIYYFGEENVEKQQQLEAGLLVLSKARQDLGDAQRSLKTLSEALATYCTDQGKLIRSLLTAPGSPYNTYNKTSFEKKCTELVAQQSSVAVLTDQNKESLRKQKDATSLPYLALITIEYPDLARAREFVDQVLQRTVTSKVIARLVDEPTIALWVKTGLALHAHGAPTVECEFCGNIIPAERMEAIEGHFNDEYHAFIEEVVLAKQTCETRVKVISDASKHDSAKLYPRLKADYETELSKLENSNEAVRSYLNALGQALDEKVLKPFQRMELTAYLSEQDVEASEKAKAQLTALNMVVADHNGITAEFKESVTIARKQLEEGLIAEVLGSYTTKSEAVDAAAKEEQRLVRLVDETQKRVDELEGHLKEYRTPADQLNAELRSFLGRDDLSLDIEETGYRVVRDGMAAGNLSEGEKTAIAFLYFLKSLGDRELDLKNSVVVVDDPVSSLDAHALYSAFGYLKAVTKNAGQLFVLTHNFGFFVQVKDWFDYVNNRKGPDKACFFMLSTSIVASVRSSSLQPLDRLLKDFKSEYHFLFKMITTCAARTVAPTDLEELYPLPNIARRTLETFLSFKYPVPGGLTNKMDKVDFDPAKKARIIRFTHSYSHGEKVDDTGMDMSLLAEAPQVMREILELFKHVDGVHYDGMISQVGEWHTVSVEPVSA